MESFITYKNFLSNNSLLPDSYDRAIYTTKCDIVFDHFLTMSQRRVA